MVEKLRRPAVHARQAKVLPERHVSIRRLFVKIAIAASLSTSRCSILNLSSSTAARAAKIRNMKSLRGSGGMGRSSIHRQVTQDVSFAVEKRHAEITLDPLILEISIERKLLVDAKRVMTKASADHILARCSDEVVLDVREDFAIAQLARFELAWRRRRIRRRKHDSRRSWVRDVARGTQKDRTRAAAVPSTIARSATISSSIDVEAHASSFDIRNAPPIAWPTLVFLF